MVGFTPFCHFLPSRSGKQCIPPGHIYIVYAHKCYLNDCLSNIILLICYFFLMLLMTTCMNPVPRVFVYASLRRFGRRPKHGNYMLCHFKTSINGTSLTERCRCIKLYIWCKRNLCNSIMPIFCFLGIYKLLSFLKTYTFLSLLKPFEFILDRTTLQPQLFLLLLFLTFMKNDPFRCKKL